MSKATLKKELESFTREQLIQVLMDTYSSSKSAKEYLEFFLNPDVQALHQKKIDIITKELRREKWGYSKARISYIKKTLKEFESFNVGDAAMERLSLEAFLLLLSNERFLHYSPTLMNGTASLAVKALEHAILNENTDKTLDNIRKALDTLATKQIKSLVIYHLNNYLEDHRLDFKFDA